MRQGGDPRLPLELALVKVTRPGADLSREGARLSAAARSKRGTRRSAWQRSAWPFDPATECRRGRRGGEEEAQSSRRRLTSSWRSSRRPGSEACCRPSRNARFRPPRCSARRTLSRLEGDTLTLEFPPAASFHRKKAEEPKNARSARRGALRGDRPPPDARLRGGAQSARPGTPEPERPATEDEIVELVKSTFDAREVERLSWPIESGCRAVPPGPDRSADQ